MKKILTILIFLLFLTSCVDWWFKPIHKVGESFNLQIKMNKENIVDNDVTSVFFANDTLYILISFNKYKTGSKFTSEVKVIKQDRVTSTINVIPYIFNDFNNQIFRFNGVKGVNINSINSAQAYNLRLGHAQEMSFSKIYIDKVDKLNYLLKIDDNDVYEFDILIN